MWNRKELKEKAKVAVKANFGLCIVAALLLTIATKGGAFSAPASVNINNDSTPTVEQSVDNENDSITIENSEDAEKLVNDIKNDINSMSQEDKNDLIFAFGAFSVIVIFIILIAIAISMVFTAFLLVPLEVGVRRFFIQNAHDSNTSLTKDNLGFSFSERYFPIIKSVFSTKVFVWLWSLLLIIPGIYKNYCWRLVPYLVSENPTLTGKEARRISNELMNGNKWNTFVLDLSFIGWIILGLFTLGILNIVWVNPYKAQTDAELFEAISKAQ